MRIVFCTYDFVASNLMLQPWLTIRHVAENLARKGHCVHLITDSSKPAELYGIESHPVASIRGSNSSEVGALLRKLNPEAIVFLPTPLNIVTTQWLHGLPCRVIGFASYPFYNSRELFTALCRIGWKETRQYLRHLLLPGAFWTRAIKRHLHAIIAQSANSAARLNDFMGDSPQCFHIPPGIDLSKWPVCKNENVSNEESVDLLYLGAATAIRGFELTLNALAQVRNPQIRLRVLARGADANRIAAIRSKISRRGLEARVEVSGGWINQAQLIQEIHAADVVVQPFVLVPSELPVTTMEVISCGTPVIATDIDGLPSTIGPAGTVVKQGSAAALAESIDLFAQNENLRTSWQIGCCKQRDSMLGWNEITEQWENVLYG